MPTIDSQHAQILRYFTWQHLTTSAARDVSREVCDLAYKLAGFLPDGPEKTTGLRKLLEAKDAFVRASFDLAGGDQ